MTDTPFYTHADDWWNPTGAFRALHQINPHRVQFVLDTHPLDGKRLLDIGCGGGLFAESATDAGATVTAIDSEDASIRAARGHAAQGTNSNIDYQTASLGDFVKTQPAPFEVITAFEVIEHTREPAAFIKDAASVLANDGYLYVSTLNRNMASWLGAIVAAEHILNLVPKGTHNHGLFIRPEELVAMARDAGLVPIKRTGIIWNPLTLGFSLHPTCLAINYMMAFQKRRA